MNNTLSLIMLAAIIGYLFFVVIRSHKYYMSLNRNQPTKHFEFGLLGLFLGLFVGIFGSSVIVDLIFTDQFLKAHQNPDVGLYGFYFLTTLILMVTFSIFSVIVYDIFIKNRA